MNNESHSTMYAVLALGILLGVIFMQSLGINRSSVSASMNEKPELQLNEHFVEEIRSEHVNLDDIDAVFWFVFSQLKDKVDVYPTENYYYFHFYTNGRKVSGNIRLDSWDREKGLLTFAYFASNNRREGTVAYRKTSRHKEFGVEDGLKMEKLDALSYSVTYRGKTVIFNLHNVPQTKPENLLLHDGEEFLYRTFDESGFQFILLHDTLFPGFRFVLDESVPLPDVLVPLGTNTLIGQLSGYTFYDEPDMNRKVLIAVDNLNISANNYYDGPFDQLADNFVNNEALRNAMTHVFPNLKGKVSDRGDFLDENGQRGRERLLLAPHIKYYYLYQIQEHIEACSESEDDPHRRLSCLTRDKKQPEKE